MAFTTPRTPRPDRWVDLPARSCNCLKEQGLWHSGPPVDSPVAAPEDGTLARQAAIYSLALTGDMRCCPRLASILCSDDLELAAAAEDALWSIWFRAGSASSRRSLLSAIRLAARNRLLEAARRIGRVVAAEPTYAEAHHQWALVLHSLGRMGAARAAYEQTLALNRYHFAAAAGLGNLFVQLEDYRSAAASYRRSLKLHPHQPAVREALQRVRRVLSRRLSQA